MPFSNQRRLKRSCGISKSFWQFLPYSCLSSVWKSDSSHLSSFHCWISIWRRAGVHLRDAPFRRSTDCGCCCNPQAAEQNPSWDFTLLSPISSLPHLLVLSSPLLSSPHLFMFFFFPTALPPYSPAVGWRLLDSELITEMSKQVERWAGCSAIDNSTAADWCRGGEYLPIHKLMQTSEVRRINLNKTPRRRLERQTVVGTDVTAALPSLAVPWKSRLQGVTAHVTDMFFSS